MQLPPSATSLEILFKHPCHQAHPGLMSRLPWPNKSMTTATSGPCLSLEMHWKQLGATAPRCSSTAGVQARTSADVGCSTSFAMQDAQPKLTVHKPAAREKVHIPQAGSLL